MTNILIVGGGPAGLAAAVAGLDAGADVTLVEASEELGGQFWRHLPSERRSAEEARLHHGFTAFRRMCSRVLDDPRCRTVLSAQVWSAERVGGRPGAVNVLVGPVDGADRERIRFEPDAIVVATGAFDRALPFPGWDLPGVFTAGAAQAMAKGERIAIGDRVIVAGAGPFLLPVAASLAQAGSSVVAVLEASRALRLAHGWLPRPWQLLGAAKKGAELGGYVLGHLAHRIPYRTGRAVVAAHGTDRVEAVTVAAIDDLWVPIPGTEQRIAVDAVCVAHGFTPRIEVAVALGCSVTAARFVAVTDRQETSVAGVFAAGELTGIGGVDLALAEGAIAGHCAAGGRVSDSAVAGDVRCRTTYSRFAARLDAAHGIGSGWSDWLDDDTIVCRCEAVPYGRLRETSVLSSPDTASLKHSTRAGLGICQGRVCGRTVDDLIAGVAGSAAAGPSVDRRSIVSPIRLAELAADAGPPATNSSPRGQSSP